ncbi:lytic murein transglycosylase [Aurantimonas sp. VKM B-3413]|uniref:lytic murein transglycosylase n=1 Tax=Aurantimonas sp. VKM B-3413 TaxID=2779401 RepID=UPI001E4EE67A|nr:lytic murein transglycosylase [Aurantimonas sp. VKM B-3413]MCB8837860.1 lytic murein transglycosylase [Aurantimonas sp. VKM B-3413]
MTAAPRLALAAALLLGGTALAKAQQCGGDFGQFLDGVRQEALAKGMSKAAIDASIADMRIDEKVLERDRAQGVFAQDWRQFASRMVNGYRLKQGKANLEKYAAVFDKVKAETGVPGPVIASFWGLETDYGAVLGSFDTLAALATLAHDCRRPELFRPHLLAAIEIVERGYLKPAEMEGAWAGEIGQTQLLPEEYVAFGTDGDGNGTIDLRKDTPDVLFTTGKYIQSLGWRRGEPWLQEVNVPENFPWERAALVNKEPRANYAALGVTKADGSPIESDQLPAALLLPMGRGGPAFLSYPNFEIYLAWNKSLVYSLTAAYFATRLDGAPPVDMGNPAPGLSVDQTKQLQQRLTELGHDVGGVDGIIGENTRQAVRAEQKRLGLPADGWPTTDLLSSL